VALGDSYASLSELKTRLGITDSSDDTALTAALATASRGAEKYCGRQFNLAALASARVYRPDSSRLVMVDDFATALGLVVATDEGDDGVFQTTWAAADYQLEPLNGVVDGEPGWPYWRIRVVGSRWFPCGRRATVQVTAQWGWAAVPAAVKEASLIMAEETFKLKDAPFGVAGFGEFGAVRVRDNPKAAGLLAPYRRNPVLVA
jgi:hypothetical protein